MIVVFAPLSFEMYRLILRSTGKRTTCSETASPSGYRETGARLVRSLAQLVRTRDDTFRPHVLTLTDYFTGVGIFFDT
jgi:hypothetical protein